MNVFLRFQTFSLLFHICIFRPTFLRVCVAAYHCKCIDTWLVEDSDLCPLCKKSVIEDDDAEQQEDASGSAGQSAAAAGSVQDTTEDAPLLQRAGRRGPHRRYGSSRRRGT